MFFTHFFCEQCITQLNWVNKSFKVYAWNSDLRFNIFENILVSNFSDLSLRWNVLLMGYLLQWNFVGLSLAKLWNCRSIQKTWVVGNITENCHQLRIRHFGLTWILSARYIGNKIKLVIQHDFYFIREKSNKSQKLDNLIYLKLFIRLIHESPLCSSFFSHFLFLFLNFHLSGLASLKIKNKTLPINL